MLDHVTVTREDARQGHAYRPGHIVEFLTALPTLGHGAQRSRHIVSMERNGVVLGMRDGNRRSLIPGRLPRNRRDDAVSVYALKDVTLHDCDRIRWATKDTDCALLKAQFVRVGQVGAQSITVTLADGESYEADRSDRMLGRLDWPMRSTPI